MDAARSKVTDGRTMTLTVASGADGVKLTVKTKKPDGTETTSEVTNELDGNPPTSTNPATNPNSPCGTAERP